jgi:hypothetical protein
LYSISPEAFGNLQRSGIVSRMSRDLSESGAAAAPPEATQ